MREGRGIITGIDSTITCLRADGDAVSCRNKQWNSEVYSEDDGDEVKESKKTKTSQRRKSAESQPPPPASPPPPSSQAATYRQEEPSPPPQQQQEQQQSQLVLATVLFSSNTSLNSRFRTSCSITGRSLYISGAGGNHAGRAIHSVLSTALVCASLSTTTRAAAAAAGANIAVRALCVADTPRPSGSGRRDRH